MNYLLTGFVQKDARILMFNPGAEICNFRNGARYVVSAAPRSMDGIPSGRIPADAQPLLTDERVLRFLDNPAVVKAAGGLQGFRHYVSSVNHCQIDDEADPYHHHELTMTRHKDGFIRTCWHHDNILRKGECCQQQADKILLRNQRAFVARSIFTDLRLSGGHLLNPSDLFTWSVMHRVSEHLPAFICSYILMQSPEEEITGTMTEHSIVHRTRSHSRIVQDIVEQIKPVVVPEIEPEPPASFMRIPKLKRWECLKYLQWVKSQPCCVCGQQADDPHHIIGHGTGGTGTKAHDIFTIPLCRIHHDELHRDVNAWERKYGSQLELLFKFMNRSYGIGVFG
ncbi:DUF968 domain-containing protein [Morganella morganii]|uniref:DUF968 domain-containing protein n=3 Tax=Enterobacterales TaxID=91347 RepID=UPI00029123B9|nr:DUF968 domain-containing protein [Morganella morganii]AVK38752.1 hypothetical protein CSB69_3702 [Morganella morganii]ELO7538169.1 DUF968 domain-containing protein [Morganella morganii]EMP51760.1 Putative cytoplasmic protein [Morganella morganii SC01]MBM7213992.1 DUF968 domain-containing protein [Morganella morganii]MBN4018183.1 DUF968 domain-containing protein [Morganella morganii]